MFKGVLIENTFTGISEMADTLFPMLKLIPSVKKRMLRVHWDNIAKIKKVKCPILFISGSIDTFVPTEMTERLFAACSSKSKTLWIVPGGNHNDTWLVGGKDYVEKIK